jgi:hypothetical protein
MVQPVSLTDQLPVGDSEWCGPAGVSCRDQSQPATAGDYQVKDNTHPVRGAHQADQPHGRANVMASAAGFKNAPGRLAGDDSAQTLTHLYQRDDWTLFRSLGTLAQKAGVPVSQLAAVATKELAENALDVSDRCRFDTCGENGFYVEDDGPGLPGTPEEIAALFSIRRPLLSSKLKRLPTRGALGNGLRVVAGVVLATGGALRVETGGHAVLLEPRDDDSTRATVLGTTARRGTRVEVHLGPALRVTKGTLRWAAEAVILASGGQDYKGKTSAYWYDDDSFYKLLQAAGDRPVRLELAEFDGCSGAKAGVVARDVLGRTAASLSRAEAAALLTRARAHTKEVTTQRLGKVGPRPELGTGYGKAEGILALRAARGTHQARLPVVVEAWAHLAARGGKDKGDKVTSHISVNRGPLAGEAAARPRASG